MTYDVELKYYFELYDNHGQFKRPTGEDLLDFQNRYHDEVMKAKVEKRKMKKHLDLQGSKNFVEFQPALFSAVMINHSLQSTAFASKPLSASRHVASGSTSLHQKVLSVGTQSTQSQPPQIPSTPTTTSMVIPVGFKNLGNSCYINSILQCMIAIDLFSSSILTGELDKTAALKSCLLQSPTTSILQDYCDLVRSVFSERKPSTKKTSDAIIRKIYGKTVPNFFRHGHQDAHEFLTLGLLDRFQGELNFFSSTPTSSPSSVSFSSSAPSLSCSFSSSSSSFYSFAGSSSSSILSPVDVISKQTFSPNLQNFIFKSFFGVETSILRCQDCSKESITDHDFSVLSLPFPPDQFQTDFETKSLSHLDLFKHFTKVENLQDDLPCPYCPKSSLCATIPIRTNGRTKQICIQEPPSILVVHLKRFNNSCAKKQQFVSFPEELDISMILSKPIDTLLCAPIMYDLKATSQHHGQSIADGHYTSTVKVTFCSYFPSFYILNI